MHLMFSAWFVFCNFLLVFFYLVAACLILSSLSRVWLYIKERNKQQRGGSRFQYTGKAWLVLLLLSLAITLGPYVFQRIVWMGPDNAHKTAKEYFVAGLEMTTEN